MVQAPRRRRPGLPVEIELLRAGSDPGGRSAGPITETAAQEEIESIVMVIRAKSPAQYAVADRFYLKGSFTVKRIAQELGCGETTAYCAARCSHGRTA